MTLPARHSSVRRVQWLLGATGLFLILVYAGLGIFNRPYADDLCMAATSRQMGIIGAVNHTYWTWSGNVTGLFYQVIGATFSIYPIGPLILLTLWIIAFTWLSFEVLRWLSNGIVWPIALIAGVLMTLAVLDLSPNLFQALYWVNGTANYAFPTSLSVILLSVLIRVARRGFSAALLWLALILTIIAVGGQITIAVFVTSGVTLALIAVALFKSLPTRDALLRMLIPVLITAILVSIAVVFTPGNDLRQAALLTYGIERQPLSRAIVIAVIAGLWMLIKTIADYGLVTQVLLFVTALGLGVLMPPSTTASYIVRPILRRFSVLFALAIGWAVFIAGVFPSAYSLGQIPEPRTWIIGQVSWVIVIALAGFVAGINFRGLTTSKQRKRAGVISLVAVLLTFVMHLAAISALVPQLQGFATDHDMRVGIIRDALINEARNPALPPHDPSVVEFTYLDPAFHERCTWQFYDLAH